MGDFCNVWVTVHFVFCCLVYGVLGFCGVQWVIFVTFRWQCVSPKRWDIHLLHSVEIRKKVQNFIFCRSSAKNSESTHNSTCTVIVCLFVGMCVEVTRV